MLRRPSALTNAVTATGSSNLAAAFTCASATPPQPHNASRSGPPSAAALPPSCLQPRFTPVVMAPDSLGASLEPLIRDVFPQLAARRARGMHARDRRIMHACVTRFELQVLNLFLWHILKYGPTTV